MTLEMEDKSDVTQVWAEFEKSREKSGSLVTESSITVTLVAADLNMLDM